MSLLLGPAARGLSDYAALFIESAMRFVVEVQPDRVKVFEACLSGQPVVWLGQTVKEPRLRIAGSSGEWVVWAALGAVKEAWQKMLRW